MLTRTPIAASFAHDGFYLLENVFSRAEMGAAKDDIKNMFTRITEGNLSYPAAGVHLGIAKHCPLVHSMHCDPRLVDPLCEIIGPDIQFWSDKLVFKSSDIGFASPWHQDYPYWHGAHKYSIWIALDDAAPDNGCLRVIPGSHASAIEHGAGDPEGIGFNNRVDLAAIDERIAVNIAVEAGSALIFHDLTLHSSFPNTSGKDRWSIISTYRDASKDDFDYSSLQDGFMVRGRWSGKCLGSR
jgi:phytanoyl-CoA hydroxylase